MTAARKHPFLLPREEFTWGRPGPERRPACKVGLLHFLAAQNEKARSATRKEPRGTTITPAQAAADPCLAEVVGIMEQQAQAAMAHLQKKFPGQKVSVKTFSSPQYCEREPDRG